MVISELYSVHAAALIQDGAGLKVMLRKFFEFQNPMSEEPGVHSSKLALKVDDPEKVFEDVQVFKMTILLRWQFCGTEIDCRIGQNSSCEMYT